MDIDKKEGVEAAIRNARSSVGRVPEMQQMYPRKYASPTGWYSPKQLAVDFLACMENALVFQDDKTAIQTALIGLEMSKYRMPLYWIGKELLEDLMITTPPKDMLTNEVSLPMPAGAIILPDNVMKDDTGNGVNWLAWAHMDKDNKVQTKDHAPGILISARTSDMAIWGSWLPDAQPLWSMAESEFEYFNPIHEVSQEGIKSSADCLLRMTMTTLNIVLYMMSLKDSGHEQFEAERELRKAKPQKNVDALWSPRWIGRTYARNKAPAGGTHASPRAHWRNAHMRKQPVGPGRKEFKVVYVKRTFVNACPSE